MLLFCINSFSCDYYDFEETLLIDDITQLRESAESCTDLHSLTNANHQNLLHLAAEYDSLESLDYLASTMGDVNTKDGNGQTPLHMVHSLEAAQILISHGARAMVNDRYGRSPLTTAMEKENFKT